MERKAPYVVSKVPHKKCKEPGLYYCHNRYTPNCPVFGSIGTKQKANEICRMMNGSRGYGKVVGRL